MSSHACVHLPPSHRAGDKGASPAPPLGSHLLLLWVLWFPPAHRHTQQSKGAQVLACVPCWVWIPVSYIPNCPPWAPARRHWALSGLGVLRKRLLRAQAGVDCCSGTTLCTPLARSFVEYLLVIPSVQGVWPKRTQTGSETLQQLLSLLSGLGLCWSKTRRCGRKNVVCSSLGAEIPKLSMHWCLWVSK